MKETVILLIILALSLFVRVYDLRSNEVFVNTDEAATLLGVLDLFHIFDEVSISNTVFYLYRLYVFPYSYVFILFNFFFHSLYYLLGIPITEFTHVLPSALIGSLVPLLVYFIGKEIHSKKAGVIGALFLSVFPMHVFISRFNGGTTHLGTFFITLTMLLFIKYFKYGTKKLAILSSISLAVYIGSEHQFPAIFPLLLFTGLVIENGTVKMRLIRTLKKLFHPRIIVIPLIISIPLFITWFYMIVDGGRYSEGHFGHVFSKQTELNFYPEVMQNIIYNGGLMLALLFLLSLYSGIKRTFTLKKEAIPFVWGILYLAPWFFLVPYTLIHRLYYVSGEIGMILFIAIFLAEIFENLTSLWLRYLFATFILLVFSLTFLTTINYVYGVDLGIVPIVKNGFWSDKCPYLATNTCDFEKYCYLGGKFEPSNWGLKTAGYYIRENFPENINIFTETGTPAAKYYFHRKIFNNKFFWMYPSGTIEEKYQYLKNVSADVSLVVARNCNNDIILPFVKDAFFKIVEITSEGKPVLNIYSKSNEPLKIMPVEIYDDLFDKKYGKWTELYAENWIYHEGFY